MGGEVAVRSASAPAHRKRQHCRACGGGRLHRFLELGTQPLANAFPRDPSEFAAEPVYPLDVYFCEDCSLVQLLDVIDPEILFRDYIYVTGTSDTIAAHNERYADAIIERIGGGPADLVVEVASNDGSLLRAFQRRGVRVLGVEPARNIAALARRRGIDTVAEFFDLDLARALRQARGPAMAVIGNNVLAHVDEPRDFLAGFRELLADDGVAVVEVPYVKELVDSTEYDTVYHEHLCYFSVTALLRLMEAAGLRVSDIECMPVHGGSLRVYARRDDVLAHHAPDVLMLAARERADGLARFESYHQLAHRVRENSAALRALLAGLAAAGKRVAGYGAPAKGNTLLNYCGIDRSLLPYTVDKNPWKVGRYTPGTHIPVAPVDRLLRDQPEYVLILAWNFADEIMTQQRAYAEAGGRFIVPIPTPRIVEP